MRLTTKQVALIGVVALPAGMLMLAKLFDSAVLGWMFGLTLMAEVALLPMVGSAYLAYRLIRWSLLRGRPMQEVFVERGSVHASDDAPSKQLRLPVRCTLREAVAQAQSDGYLPRISGGKATWVVECSDGAEISGRPVAVVAEQWRAAAFIADPKQTLASFFGARAAVLRFRYRCQEDPEALLADLKAGE